MPFYYINLHSRFSCFFLCFFFFSLTISPTATRSPISQPRNELFLLIVQSANPNTLSTISYNIWFFWLSTRTDAELRYRLFNCPIIFDFITQKHSRQSQSSYNSRFIVSTVFDWNHCYYSLFYSDFDLYSVSIRK